MVLFPTVSSTVIRLQDWSMVNVFTVCWVVLFCWCSPLPSRLTDSSLSPSLHWTPVKASLAPLALEKGVGVTLNHRTSSGSIQISLLKYPSTMTILLKYYVILWKEKNTSLLWMDTYVTGKQTSHINAYMHRLLKYLYGCLCPSFKAWDSNSFIGQLRKSCMSCSTLALQPRSKNKGMLFQW